MELFSYFLQNNIILILLLILFVLCVIALVIFAVKKDFSKNITIIKDNNGKDIKLKEYITTYKNGDLKSKYYLFKNNKHYKESFYFKSGEINKTQTWNNGILNGESKTYYKTGELYILSNFKNGKLDGNYIVYNKSGSIIQQYKYNLGVMVNE